MKRPVSSSHRVKTAGTLPAPAEGNMGEDQGDRSVVTSYRWAWYGLALLAPLAGIFVAIFLYGQESREVRHVGRNCLIIGFLFWVVFPLLMLFSFFLFTVLLGFQLLSEIMPAWY
jgi:hypothetical protein